MELRYPYIGEDVIYEAYGTPCGTYGQTQRAAKITGIYYHARDIGLTENANDSDSKEISGTIADIVVFNPTGIFFTRKAMYGTLPGSGRWHRSGR